MNKNVLKISDNLESFLVSNLNSYDFDPNLTESNNYFDIFYGMDQNSKKSVKMFEIKDKKPNDELFEFFFDLIKIHYQLSHPFIQSLIGFTDHHKFRVIIENGDSKLSKFIKNNDITTNGTLLNKIAMSIALAMCYMHKSKYIHCRLSPINIFLVDNNVPKISHLLDSHKFNEIPLERKIPKVPNYSAPEYLDEKSEYNEKIDVFSFGMILYELATGERPYSDLKSDQVIHQIKNQKRPIINQRIPKKAAKLIEECWDDNPSKRPSFESIFQQFYNNRGLFSNNDELEYEHFLNTIEKLKNITVKERATIQYIQANRFDNEDSKGSYSRHKTKSYSKNDHYNNSNDKTLNTSIEKGNGKKKSPFDSPSNEMETVLKRKNSNKIINNEGFSSDDLPTPTSKREKEHFHSPTNGYEMETVLKGKVPRKMTQKKKFSKIEEESNHNFLELSNEKKKNCFVSTTSSKKSKSIHSHENKNCFQMRTVIRNNSIPTPIFEKLSDSSMEESSQVKKSKTKEPISLEDFDKWKKVLSSKRKRSNIKSIFEISDFRKPKVGEIDDNIVPLNLKIIAKPSHPKFEKEISEAESRLKPNQYDLFFKILASHLQSSLDKTTISLILKTIASVLNSDEAFDSLIKSNLINYLPYNSKLVNSTFLVLELLFQFRPIAFQENYVKTMNELIELNPEKSLVLLTFYAQSFEYIENPWPIIDLLVTKEDIFINSKDPSKYIAILLFLNIHFANYVRSRLKYCRVIFLDGIESKNHDCVAISYKAISLLLDEYFEINPQKLFKDLQNFPQIDDYILKIIDHSKDIPIKEEYLFILINEAHKTETASKLLIKLLQSKKAAIILINNSKWMGFYLPTINYTIKIFLKIISHDSIIDQIKLCSDIPIFFILLLESDDNTCLQQFSIIVQKLNIVTLDIFQKSDFFDILYQKMKENYKEEKILLYLSILSVLSAIDYSKKFLLFTDILKYCLKSVNGSISHSALHCLSNLSYHHKCANNYTQNNIFNIAAKYCQRKEDRKYLKRLRENC